MDTMDTKNPVTGVYCVDYREIRALYGQQLSSYFLDFAPKSQKMRDFVGQP